MDGSGSAEIVLPYVKEIATKLSTEITLVSVSESSATDIDNLYRSYLEHITRQVKRQLKDWGATEDLKTHSKVLLGKPDSEILLFAGEHNGSHSHGRP